MTKKIRRAKTMLILYQIHLWTGLSLCVPFVLVGLTGMYMVFPQTVGGIFTDHDMRAPVKVVESEKQIKLDDIINLATKEVPDQKLQSINFPQKPDQAYRLSFSSGKSREAQQTTVFVDQYQGKVAAVRDPKEAGNGDSFVAWMRAVHSGKAFGFLWKFVIFTVAFTPLLFSITGVTMWLIKRRAKNKKLKRKKKNEKTRSRHRSHRS